jgi:hypothetical protein
LFAALRPPRAEFNAPGGFMIDLPDLPHLAAAKSSFAALRDGMHMGLEAGGTLDGDNLANGIWAVASL